MKEVTIMDYLNNLFNHNLIKKNERYTFFQSAIIASTAIRKVSLTKFINCTVFRTTC